MKAWPLIILAAMSLPAFAGPRDGLVPVDQAVADLDPHAISLRRVEAGLRYEGEQNSRLFVVAPAYSAFSASGALGQPVNPPYYRLGKGFVARVDRINYLVRYPFGGVAWNVSPMHDGEFIELIPANTVYELKPIDLRTSMPPVPASSTPPPAPTPAPNQINTMIDGRVKSTRVEPQRVDARPTDHR